MTDSPTPVSGDAMELVERLTSARKGARTEEDARAIADAQCEIERLRSQGGAPEGIRLNIENVAQLEAILANATGGPWEWTTFTKPDGRPITCVEDIAETTAASARKGAGIELHGITPAGLGEHAEGPNVICYTGNGPCSAANARAIVSLWMAAPDLLKLARAMLSAAPQPPEMPHAPTTPQLGRHSVNAQSSTMLIDGKEWKLVPVEPTEAMTRAGIDPFLAAHDPFYAKNEPTAPIYRAMLSAAPQPPEGGTGWRPVPGDASPSMVMAALAVDWSGGDGDEEAVVHNVWNAMLGTAPSPPGQGDRTNDGEAGEFKPDWSLTENESAQVALSLALTRYVPGWPGATNEQLGAVASDVLAALPRKDVEGAAYRVGDRVEKYTGDAMYVGTVVSVYLTVRGKLRYVVDVEPQRFQMISNESQLRPAIRDLGKQTGGAS